MSSPHCISNSKKYALLLEQAACCFGFFLKSMCGARVRILKLVWFWLLWGVITAATLEPQHPKSWNKQGKHILWCVPAVTCAREQQGLAALQGEVTWESRAGCKASRAELGVATRFSQESTSAGKSLVMRQAQG